MSSVDTVTSTRDPRAANVVRYKQNFFEYSDYEFDSEGNEFHECSLLEKYACIYKSNIAAGLDDFAVIDDDAELNEENSIITIPHDLAAEDFNPDVYGEFESNDYESDDSESDSEFDEFFKYVEIYKSNIAAGLDDFAVTWEDDDVTENTVGSN
jgi:hypothetical protein